MGFKKIAEEGAWSLPVCRDPEHEPPGHVVLAPGTYEYTCPGCGRKKFVRVPRAGS